jgi:excisionase family DNA binding protein
MLEKGHQPPLLNTIPQTCVRLGISRSKLYEKIATGEIEAVKVDGSTRITEAGILAFTQQLPRVAPRLKRAAA